MESKCSRLDELAERSAFKNGGTSANYITANQALRDDMTLLLNAQFGSVLSEIQALKAFCAYVTCYSFIYTDVK